MAVQRAFGTLLLGPLLLPHGVRGVTAITKLGSMAHGIAGKEESGTCAVARWVLDDAAGGKDCDTVCANVNMVCDNVGFGKDTPEELQAIYAEYPEISGECGGDSATTPILGTAPVQPTVWSTGNCYRSNRSPDTLNYWCVRDNRVSVGKERCKADDWGNVFAYRRICPCQHSEADKCPMPSGTALTGDASTCLFEYDNAPSTEQAQPTPAPAPGSATGDPHLQNIHGERFDLMRPGNAVLIQIPRGHSVEKALLTVEADARRLGSQCADIYFQSLNITGVWADKMRAGGLAFTAGGARDETLQIPGWMNFGPLKLKVVRGRTSQGIEYLNFYIKNLGEAGAAVGGLLGEDDYTVVATPESGCRTSISLDKQAISNSGLGHTEAIATLA